MTALPVDAQITFLYTGDLERADSFYRGTLGLELALDQGQCRIYRVRPGAYVGLCARQAPAAAEATCGSDCVILTLVCSDVAGWAKVLTERGAELEGPPAVNPAFGIHHFFLRDPDGHRLEIQRFLDPRWRG
jgi:catechol 2,3-dioxygenase-like lactoylglutathione lyase family enzyme